MSRLSPRAVTAIEVATLLALCGLAVWLRWPALWTEGFHNEDAAGIAYNADLLRHGGLPLVDNVELKAPGSFYVAWMSWGLFGRSIATLQQVACAWAVVGGLGVYFGGKWLFDRRAGAIAALIYVVFSPITDSIDINYGAWMAAPYIWSAALFVRAMKTGRGRWLLFCGAALAIAGLMKRQGAFATPVFLALLVVGARLPRPEDWAPAMRARPALVWFFGGLAAGFLPIMLYYLARGELGAFVANYFFSEGGWKYAGSPLAMSEKPGRVGDGLLGFFEYMATATGLAILTAAAALRSPRQRWGVRAIFLSGHFWLSFLGAAVGLRFFKGYYLQVLPAAAWIAAHPSGALRRWLDIETWRGLSGPRQKSPAAPNESPPSAALLAPRRAASTPAGSRLAADDASSGSRRRFSPGAAWAGTARAVGLLALLGLVLTPALIHDLGELRSIRKRRAQPRDVAARTLGELVKANTDADDRVWVWGRWAWPVYFHADRLAATRFPKTLAVFTTNLTNTWRRPTKPTRFEPKSDWKALIADLERDKPAFVVLSQNEDYSAFTALKALMRKEYRAVPGHGQRGFSVYRRKDLELRAPPKRATRRSKRPKRPTRTVRPKPAPEPTPAPAPTPTPKTTP